MKKAMVTLMAMLAWGAVEAAGRQPADSNSVRVKVYYDVDPNVALNGMTLSMAETRASELLADAGIRLEWHSGKPREGEMGRQTIGMTFVPFAPPSFQTAGRLNALAAANPYGAGTTITVFNDRIMAYLTQQGAINRGKVLGHILAHEIVHVLQRVCRHSETGLMSARWGWREMALMTGAGMSLAEQDKELLRMWFIQPALAASAAPAAVPDATQ